MDPAGSLRRGQALLETVLVIPLTVLIALGCVQLLLLVEIDWALDQAAEAACRAAVVADDGHPDPAVAAQMVMAPVTGRGLVRGQPPLPGTGLTGTLAGYGSAILKTRTEIDVDGRRVVATVTHAAELRIPLVGMLVAPVEGPLKALRRRVFEQDAGDWVDDIALVSGRPHLKLEKSLAIDFGS